MIVDEEQWQVVWFPPDRRDATYTTSQESVARAKYNAMRDAGYAPILNKRTLYVSEWETIANDTFDEARKRRTES